MKRLDISAGCAVTVDLSRDQRFRIVNTEGGQVVDTWAFNATDVNEHLSMEHSRSAIYRFLFRPGDTLVSNCFQPIISFIDDTSPGLHDTLHAACSSGSNAFYGAEKNRPNCQDNLKNQMAARGRPRTHVPCPWNLFEHALVNDQLELRDEPSTAAAGDYVELRAEMNILLVCSACPSQVGQISGTAPRGAAVDIL